MVLKALTDPADLVPFSAITQTWSESSLKRLGSLARRAAGDSLRNLSWGG